ncbi:hypothetical protein AOL_s00043g145 [Orbilia oligospora ATCC 24927]|uniref:Peptidase A1 domain-containing protein n=1 Tax=Arthrobotrys oligospora (strain ATCC 24927 / CBS 115.81 / DSM 1491) TaxID=756982 RepID=G1X372_ARTOA|nr:hypothetical protein AOL_s00043g145 [Orbilia oligospora ATCC 24927]EGX52356.1 hypothetical protein AOL_s00043g145 [Orbilia oligospora ATCC 24927]
MESIGISDSLRRRETTIPFPVEVDPSQEWDGKDGPWSTFAVRIGTPPQVAGILPGTGSNQQMVVLPEGCMSSKDTSTCPNLRGFTFKMNESTTWENNTLYSSTSIYELGVEKRLGFEGNAIFGYDNMVLGWLGSDGPNTSNQSIAGIATKDFFLGVLGLNPRPTNFSTFNNPVPSLLQNLRDAQKIPSLSWGYTAGNQYRFNNVFGQLILGGYDSSRFVRNNIYIPFDSQDLVDLSVNIERITSSDADGTRALLPSSGISAYLDSSVSYIWLPLDACQRFEEEFGITWNDSLELYLVNNTQHEKLLTRNASIVFRIGHFSTNQTVDITFPYAAFDLTLSYPYTTNPARYFPLKRAANDSQYTLGRVFFQEAYVIADYERKNFSVFQCNWDASGKKDIVAIISPQDVQLPQDSDSSSSKLHTGALAGIAIGVVVGIIIAVYLIFRYYMKPKIIQNGISRSGPSIDSSEGDKRGEIEDLPPPTPYQMHLWAANEDAESDVSGASIRSENMTIASSIVPSQRTQRTDRGSSPTRDKSNPLV